MDIKRQLLDNEDSNDITDGSPVTVLVKLANNSRSIGREQPIWTTEEQPAEDGQGNTNKNRTKGQW